MAIQLNEPRQCTFRLILQFFGRKTSPLKTNSITTIKHCRLFAWLTSNLKNPEVMSHLCQRDIVVFEHGTSCR